MPAIFPRKDIDLGLMALSGRAGRWRAVSAESEVEMTDGRIRVDSFQGKTAVVTGGGTGMGRELCLQLVEAGCNVATCDIMLDNLKETERLCKKRAPNIKVSLHACDVAEEAAMLQFRDEVIAEHGETLHLLFNNAGIGGGGSFVIDEDRRAWEKTFAVCWYGVYFGCRAFMPNLVKADEAHIVNTSSVNGFWATVGPTVPHTSYCAAKFAVKGFSEALITDLRIHAPHVQVSIVMPGHIGTPIIINSGRVLGYPDALDMSSDDVRSVRERMMSSSGALSESAMNLSDDQIRAFLHQRRQDVLEKAPTTAKEAASVILDGVRNNRWRILVGDDAAAIDQRVRESPEHAYEPEFFENMTASGILDQLSRSLAL